MSFNFETFNNGSEITMYTFLCGSLRVFSWKHWGIKGFFPEKKPISFRTGFYNATNMNLLPLKIASIKNFQFSVTYLSIFKRFSLFRKFAFGT